MVFNEGALAPLRRLLEVHEGRRRYPYLDTVGKLTIGVGFNLDDEGLYEEEIDFILDNRIAKAVEEAERGLPEFKDLSAIRKVVVLDMLFNLGLPRLRGFKRMWAAISRKDYDEAAVEMLDSKWHRQVGQRAKRLAQMMRTDEWPINI